MIAPQKRSAETQGRSRDPCDRAPQNSTRPGAPFRGSAVQVTASVAQEPFGSGCQFLWKQKLDARASFQLSIAVVRGPLFGSFSPGWSWIEWCRANAPDAPNQGTPADGRGQLPAAFGIPGGRVGRGRGRRKSRRENRSSGKEIPRWESQGGGRPGVGRGWRGSRTEETPHGWTPDFVRGTSPSLDNVSPDNRHAKG